MSTLDETPDAAVQPRSTGAQTVAPVQASQLLFAASILGEASYTPEQELKGTLNATRAHEPAPQPAPVAAPAAAPVAAPQPAPVAAPRPSVVPPARVEEPVEPVKKGFFARLVDKLLGRG
ncbi:hypothetical protein [Kineococcus sp. SYSU DK003]|uniref:hypothetical protein n=1 Tax=Kineococcus sp. SYSU DK003 TaxID=3383124 RepID=UPI003D7DC412